MQKLVLGLLCGVALTVAAYMAYAQAEHQVDDKGYIDIGSYTETATKKPGLRSSVRKNEAPGTHLQVF